MESTAKLKENLTMQLSEIEMLQSIFCNPGEIRIEEATVLDEMQRFVDGNSATEAPPYVDLTVNVRADSDKFELCANLSHEYPTTRPDLFVRNPSLDRRQHRELNRDLTEYVRGLEQEPCLYSAICWLQENGSKYKSGPSESGPSESAPETTEQSSESDQMVRLWIYSHHIYSKYKRREILNLAHGLQLTGFCLPGKPGIICVEGSSTDCGEWWSSIKAINWKRIFCKITEDCAEDGRKFADFREIAFQINGSRSNHMDMGELNRFLKAHQCQYVFKDLFGVEGRSNEDD